LEKPRNDQGFSIRSFELSLIFMRPDFAHKLFTDQRGQFSLLMETLAMDSYHSLSV